MLHDNAPVGYTNDELHESLSEAGSGQKEVTEFYLCVTEKWGRIFLDNWLEKNAERARPNEDRPDPVVRSGSAKRGKVGSMHKLESRPVEGVLISHTLQKLPLGKGKSHWIGGA